MCAVQGAERVCQRVHGAKSLLERRGAHARGSQHLCTRIDVVAVSHGLRQVLHYQSNAFDRDTRRQRVK